MSIKVLAQNKKALFDYEILDRLEAGIVLTGNEVKSARAGHVSLVGAFGNIHQGELFLINCTISPYSHAAEHKKGEESRSRKLLIHKREINRLIGDISRKGVTLVALKMYLNDKNRIKVEIGIAKHKKAASKKAALKERDIRRETERVWRGR